MIAYILYYYYAHAIYFIMFMYTNISLFQRSLFVLLALWPLLADGKQLPITHACMHSFRSFYHFVLRTRDVVVYCSSQGQLSGTYVQ